MAVAETDSGESALYGLDLESRKMVLDTLQLVRERLLPKEKILELDREETFPEEIIREMMGPEIGLHLLFIPEAYGGMGGGARDSCALTREMAKICLGVATAFFAIQLGADPIMFSGTEEQKEKWLGRIAEGESLVAYAVTESEAGSNLAALKTKAEPVADESGRVVAYVLNGSKQFISNGGYADFLTVLANAPEGPTFFIVEKDMEGFEPGKAEEKHGIRASNTSALTFTDVRVPAENLLGDRPGLGLKQANKVFGHTRLVVAALGIGAGEAALGIALQYAKERIQFGTPLSEKQGYNHKLIVSNAVRLEAAAAYMEVQAARLDSGEEDLQVEGSIAKYFATEAGNRAAEDAVQALGGYGYIAEYEVEKIKRDVKITCIYEGTSEIQQSIIGMFRWRSSMKSKWRFYEEMAEAMDRIAEEAPAAGGKTFAKAARGLNSLIRYCHENKLTKQQYVMFCLADTMTHVEIGVALAKKAAQFVGQESANARKMLAMSRIFAADVAELVTRNWMRIVPAATISGAHEEPVAAAPIGIDELAESHRGLIRDMDEVAEILYESV